MPARAQLRGMHLAQLGQVRGGETRPLTFEW